MEMQKQKQKKTQKVTKIRKNKTNSTNLYPPTKGYLRETCKSKNINPITFSIIQIITNACQVCLVLSLIKKKYTYEGHPINRGNFLITQELVQLKHRKCNHKVA